MIAGRGGYAAHSGNVDLSVEKWRFPKSGTELDAVAHCASCITVETDAHIVRVGL